MYILNLYLAQEHTPAFLNDQQRQASAKDVKALKIFYLISKYNGYYDINSDPPGKK